MHAVGESGRLGAGYREHDEILKALGPADHGFGSACVPVSVSSECYGDECVTDYGAGICTDEEAGLVGRVWMSGYDAGGDEEARRRMEAALGRLARGETVVAPNIRPSC